MMEREIRSGCLSSYLQESVNISQYLIDLQICKGTQLDHSKEVSINSREAGIFFFSMSSFDTKDD